MKKYSTIALLTIFSAVAIALAGFVNPEDKQVRHIVVFKYKAGATEAQIAQVTKAFGEMKKTIPGIVSFEHGVNDSPEKKNQGFTHVYQVTFESAQARDTYLPHPEHKKFGQLLKSLDILDDLFVVDYAAKVKL
ncbi:MAG TPA: Dabb family protein [Cyclobacteriaceae bacterium]|nr:Dabb family protein [Cyclobacteriaceae bacterium]